MYLVTHNTLLDNRASYIVRADAEHHIRNQPDRYTITEQHVFEAEVDQETIDYYTHENMRILRFFGDQHDPISGAIFLRRLPCFDWACIHAEIRVYPEKITCHERFGKGSAPELVHEFRTTPELAEIIRRWYVDQIMTPFRIRFDTDLKLACVVIGRDGDREVSIPIGADTSVRRPPRS